MSKEIRTGTLNFGSTTSSLKGFGEWFYILQVTVGTMESTGIYCKPVLHAHSNYSLNLLAVNARHIINVPNGAIGIVAEIGVDVNIFPSEHHLASHSGMCPGNSVGAGKKKAQEPD